MRELSFWTWGSRATLGLFVASAFWRWTHFPDLAFGVEWWTLVSQTVTGLLTEVTFAFGHENYLRNVLETDLSWISQRTREQAEEQLRRRARWDYTLMYALLIARALMSVSLAAGRPGNFVEAFLLLMLADVLFSAFEPRVLVWSNWSTFEPCRWMWTNLATALLILLFGYLQLDLIGGLCTACALLHLVIALGNRLADLRLRTVVPVS